MLVFLIFYLVFFDNFCQTFNMDIYPTDIYGIFMHGRIMAVDE